MITQDISKKVLTIGCQWKKPKGGIAVVLNSYSRIFPYFNIVANSNGKNSFVNGLQLLYSIVITFFKLLFCKSIKIVHIHTASYNSFRRSAFFISLAKTFKKKVIIHIHGGGFKEYYEKKQVFVKKYLRKCDIIIALTEYWKAFFQSIGFVNTVIIENIIDFPTIVENKKNDSKLHIIYLGLITKQKGIYDLLETIKDHKTDFCEKIVLHIGGNGEIETLKKYITQYNLTEIVKFEGWVSGEKKNLLLNKADIFILPSYTEGLPISILEAMSYSLPIISTSIGGIPEIVQNEENGFLIQPGDMEALYNAIIKLSASKEIREKMGKISYQKVQSYFPDKVSEKLETIYNKLLYN